MKKIISWATSLNLIAGLIVVNILLSFWPFLRLDLSRNKIHSIAGASRKIVRELDDVVNVDVYLSQELPPEVKPTADSLKAILEELARVNQSKLRVEYFDPLKDDEAKQKADNLGIRPLQFSTVKSDKFEVSNAYFGLALVYEDKEVVLPVAGDVGNMEYFLISGIKQLIEDKKIGVAVDEAVEAGQTSQIQLLNQFLQKDYQTGPVDWEAELPDQADVLVMVAGGADLPTERQEKLKKWLDEGKGLALFLDKVQVSETMMAQENETAGWDKFLADEGIKINVGLVRDKSSAIANFSTNSGMFLTRYDYWLQIRPENINSQIPALSGIETLMLPWVSAMEIGDDWQALFYSSSESVIDETMNNLSPEQDEIDTEGERRLLGAIKTEGRRLAVVADADLIKDMFVSNNRQNLFLALNLVDYMGADESLLKIRSKTVASSPIKFLEDGQKQMVKIIGMILPIVILVAVGVGVGKWRQKRNEKQ